VYACICAIFASSQALASSEQDLFIVITHFCGFALGFGLHLFFGASPMVLLLFVLSCVYEARATIVVVAFFIVVVFFFR
jgi:hypothetical protein